MLVLGLPSKDRMPTKDKANICNPKVNRGCPPLTANRISEDCVQISLGPPVQYIPLRVYHTGGFNAMELRVDIGLDDGSGIGTMVMVGHYLYQWGHSL